jgi:hypothetical protein
MRGVIAGFFFFVCFSICGQDTTRVSLLFVGDIMQHESQLKAAYDPITQKYNYKKCFQFVKPLIQAADVAIGNLELPLGGKPYTGYPVFSGPDDFAKALKEIGFDVLVTANNHSLDRGKKGLERTIDVLDSLKILHTGTFKNTEDYSRSYPLVVEKNGIRVSILNYTYGTNGIPIPDGSVVNLLDTAVVSKDFEKAKNQNTDAIIAYIHWGSEYLSDPNFQQKALAEFLFRKGAKIVVGSHPHVLQPIQWIKPYDQLIAYSLGNFISAQRLRYRDGGTLLNLELEKISSDQGQNETHIKNASYNLTWVYLDSAKEFSILPVQDFESDTSAIKERESRQMFKQFASDSRDLFSKMNLSVYENHPQDSVYHLLLVPSDSLKNKEALLKLNSLNKDTVAGRVTVGEFSDKKIAQKALEEIRSKTAYRDAKIIAVKKKRKS